MSQKAVKSISLALGATTFKVIEAAPNTGKNVEDIDVTDFADLEQILLPHPQPKNGVIAMVIADDGTAVPPTVGVVGSYTITTIYTDGTTPTTVTKTISGYFGKADPVTVQVGGERRPAWNCEFRAVGVSTTTTTAG
jgi:hypothetical protein